MLNRIVPSSTIIVPTRPLWVPYNPPHVLPARKPSRAPWWKKPITELFANLPYSKGGKPFVKSGVNVAGESGCGCCGSPAAPCICSYPTGLSSTYIISGFGALGTCPLCDPDLIDSAWDGTMHYAGTGCIWWAANASFDPLSINGVMLDIVYTQILLRTTSIPCRWELYIACGSAINPTQTMWYGYKTIGNTPVGTYTFVGSDCGDTGPATMAVML